MFGGRLDERNVKNAAHRMKMIEILTSIVEDNAPERRMRRKSAGPSELKSNNENKNESAVDLMRMTTVHFESRQILKTDRLFMLFKKMQK